MTRDGNGTAADEESTAETASAEASDENDEQKESTEQPLTGPMEVDTEPLGDTPMDEPPPTA